MAARAEAVAATEAQAERPDLALWVALLLVRVRYEEVVLAAAFPEYPEYRRRVRAFGVIG